MKKKLLFAFMFASTFTGAQTLTQANEPGIGELSTMFLVDSFANNYDAISGAGVTWDYSDLAGYALQTRDVEVFDATTTADAASYPTSTKAIQVGTSILTYFNSSATDRTSQGFKFNEPTLGDVIVTFENDEQVMISYPFGLGNYLADTYDGSVSYNLGLPTTEALTGNAYAWQDGNGTMLFPYGVSVSNVLRYKSVDTSWFTAPIVGAVEIIREQYEYYDHATQNLPIFIHATITVQQQGGGAPIGVVSLVLSKYETEEYVGINEVEQSFDIYPNPATDYIRIKGNFNNSSVGTIHDQTGRLIKSFDLNSEFIDVADFVNGLYIITIESNGSVATEQFVKK